MTHAQLIPSTSRYESDPKMLITGYWWHLTLPICPFNNVTHTVSNSGCNHFSFHLHLLERKRGWFVQRHAKNPDFFCRPKTMCRDNSNEILPTLTMVTVPANYSWKSMPWSSLFCFLLVLFQVFALLKGDSFLVVQAETGRMEQVGLHLWNDDTGKCFSLFCKLWAGALAFLSLSAHVQRDRQSSDPTWLPHMSKLQVGGMRQVANSVQFAVSVCVST